MHNPVGPWQEANELYIEQSQLKSHLTKDLENELVIYDVGLGAAANAVATLHAVRNTQRKVRIVSFEIDLELMHFALENSQQLEYLAGYENCIQELLDKKIWQSTNITWELHHGDFLNCIDPIQHKCDLVYYDPYSPKQNSEMWSTECFRKLRKQCKPRATLYNFSQATSFRAALLEAGFYVGFGQSTGLKQDTTQAAMQLEDLARPLDERWLQRWKRSPSAVPFGCTDEELLKRTILNHNQFKHLFT